MVNPMNGNELEEKNNFIRKITELTPTLITAYNIHSGKYLFVNKALKTILGYEPQDLLEKGVDFLLSLVHPDDMRALITKNQEQLEKANLPENIHEDIVVSFLYRLKHKDGKYRWIRTYGTVFTRDTDNKIQDVLNVSLDVTEEKKASRELRKKIEQLRKSEEVYHSMIKEVQDYTIILLDIDGTVVNWNIGAEKIKGYTSDEIIGQSFAVFYTDEDRKDGLPEELLRTAREEGRAVHEGWRVRKNRTVFWGNTVFTALHNKKNEVIGFSKVTHDLTERKIAEDQLKKYAQSVHLQNKRLEQANKELESFSYIASHDLQEPLRKIQAFSNRLLEKEYDSLSDWGKDVFLKIQSSATRMQKLIDSLLNFSRLENTPSAYKKTDLNILLEEVKSNLTEQIELKSAEIKSDPLPVMNCVPFHFQQLFYNLLSNSLKYSRPGVLLRIDISHEIISGKQIRLHPIHVRRKYHHIVFKDNGIGFEQQYAEKIFELFQRLHGKAEYEGTGIGLAICKKIVENHHGFIHAIGEPGQGSEFHIFLPE